MDPTRVISPAGCGSIAFDLPVGAQRARTAGVDVVDVARLGLALRRIGPALEHRICTAAEHDILAADPARRLLDLAAMFAVKESVLKAFGGIAHGARFTDIDTAGLGPVNDTAGLGPVRLRGATAAQADRLGVTLLTGTAKPAAGTVLAWAVAVPVADL
ncbi:MAG: holo-ACP synthase [Pseudonocardiaceae bacterium]